MDLKRIVDETKNSVVETYYESGQVESRTNYKADKLDGLNEGKFIVTGKHYYHNYDYYYITAGTYNYISNMG